MDESTCVNMLEGHGIKPTSNRIVVLKALAGATHPLSISDLEKKILTIDKSGIFRSLMLFREHHLVHALEDGYGGMKYELCLSHDKHEDEDTHVHFYCEHCRRLFCLHDMPIPPACLPEGYVVRTINYVAKGLCPQCAGKAR